MTNTCHIIHTIQYPKEPKVSEGSWVPLAQSAIWPLFALILLLVLRKHIAPIALALRKRIEHGSSVTVGPVIIGEPPKGITNGTTGAVAVSDGGTASAAAVLGDDSLNGAYDTLVKEGYFLLHAVEVINPRTLPRSGRYRVRVWLESYADKGLEEVVSVTYRVWGDFQQPLIATASRVTSFDLWANIYGEFPVLASVERKGKPPLTIGRYIDLPGRPVD